VPAVHVVVVVIVHVRMRRFREHETFVDVHLGSILQNSIYVCMYVCKLYFFGQRTLVPLLLLRPQFFPIILFGFTTLLTRMTGKSLHMQWPLTSQLHGSVYQRKQLVFC
jgi:hypothetical protein